MKNLKLICLTILNLLLFTTVANANLVDKIVEKAAGGKAKDLVQGELSFGGTTIWILLAVLLLSTGLLNLAFQIAGQFGGVSSTPIGDSLQSTITGTATAAASGAGALLGAGARKGLSLGREGIRAYKNRSIDSAPSAGAKDFEEKGGKGKPPAGTTPPGGKPPVVPTPPGGKPPVVPTPSSGGKPTAVPAKPTGKPEKKASPEKGTTATDPKKTAVASGTDASKPSAGTEEYRKTVETPTRERTSLLGRVTRWFNGNEDNLHERNIQKIDREQPIKGGDSSSLLSSFKQLLSDLEQKIKNNSNNKKT